MMSLVRALVRWPFRRRSLARALFGIDFGRLARDDYYFDLVTLPLVRRVTEAASHGRTVLDLGTGPHAVVGLSLWRRTGVRVVAADIDPEIVKRATAAVIRNGAPIPVVESRLLDAFDGESFDVVAFNPPYVPPRVARAMALPEDDRVQWDGGADGFAVISAFLRALAAYQRPVTALVGVNRWFIRPQRVAQAATALPALRYRGVWRARIFPADIHTIECQGR